MALLKPPITFQGSEPAIADHVNTVISDIYYELNNLGGRGNYAYRSITGDSIRTNTIDQSNVNNTIVTASDGVAPVNMNSVPVIIDPQFEYIDGYLNWGASRVEVNGTTYMMHEGAAYGSVPLTSENWYFYIIIYDGSPSVEAGVSSKSEVTSVMEQGYRKWHMYHINYNGGNVIYTPIALSPVVHAELIEAGTISADKLQVGMIYTENINVGGVVVDESGNYVSGSGLYADTTGNVVIGGYDAGQDGKNAYSTYYLWKYGTSAPSVSSINASLSTSGVLTLNTADGWSTTIPTSGIGVIYVTKVTAQIPDTDPLTITSATSPGWQTAVQWQGPTGATGATGATGPRGATGATGPAGANGRSIFTGSSAPVSPVTGDVFVPSSSFDTFAAGDFYQYNGSTWSVVNGGVTAKYLKSNILVTGNALIQSTLQLGSDSTPGILSISDVNNSSIRMNRDTPFGSGTNNGVYIGRYSNKYLATIGQCNGSGLVKGLYVDSDGNTNLKGDIVATENIAANAITRIASIQSVHSNYIADSQSGTTDKWRGLVSFKVPKEDIKTGVRINVSGHFNISSLTNSNRHVTTLWSTYVRGNSIVKNGSFAWICTKSHTSSSANNPAIIDTLNPLNSNETYYWVPINLTSEELDLIDTWSSGESYTAQTYSLPLMGLTNQYAVKQSFLDSPWCECIPMSFGCTPVGDGTEDGYIIIYGVDSITVANYSWFDSAILSAVTMKR